MVPGRYIYRFENFKPKNVFSCGFDSNRDRERKRALEKKKEKNRCKGRLYMFFFLSVFPKPVFFLCDSWNRTLDGKGS